MAQLIMRRGPKPGTVFPVGKEVVTIGSGSRNDVVILDNDVSREHCKLVRRGALYELHDLDSRYGTFVAGQRVRGAWALASGTIIELGDAVTLEFEQDETVEASPGEAGVQRQRVTPAANRTPDSYPFLVLMVGPKPGTVYPLRGETINLGRDLTNDILIQDPEISRFHLRLRRVNTEYEVEDLNSTNGVLLNGQRVTGKRALNPEDVLQVGTMVEFRYTWDPDRDTRSREKTAAPPLQTKPLAVPMRPRETTETNILGARSKLQTSQLGTGMDTGELVGHVFVAYAREEWESIVVPLTVVLQDAGIKIWVDQYLAQAGEDWMIAVEQALSECWLLLVVVSPLALASRHVPLAYRYFYNREKPIVPFMFRTVNDLPPELSQTKPIKYDIHNLKHTFDTLIATIKQSKNGLP